MNVRVKKSRIQGKGVFAGIKFREGEMMLKIDDSHIVNDESKLTEKQKQYDCDWLGDKTVLLQAPEKFINHSCDPNSYTKTVRGARTVFAMKNISKDEEITSDYVINGYYDSAMKCNCGSKKCRKILNCNFFKLPKPLQRKYLPYLDTWFKRMFKKELKQI